MATIKGYATGGKAIDLNEDGSGFIFYPNGQTAVAIATASTYQNSYYAFDSDRKSSLLAAVDEKGIGFIQTSKRKSSGGEGGSFVLGKARGLYSNADDIVEHEWKWEQRKRSSGDPPPSSIIIKMNENLSFTIMEGSRALMSLQFECDGVKHNLDIGIKARRNDSYLDNARRDADGKLVIQHDHVTLKQRTTRFNELMQAQRNKVNPKSENLSDMVKDIVATLESKFDTFKADTLGHTGLGKDWKSEAFERTLGEIPRIPISGAESGKFTGFGESIYKESKDIDFAASLPSNLVNGTRWKADVEIRAALQEANPPIQRTAVLTAASGRYSSMAVIDRTKITPANPTGMMTPEGMPLIHTAWNVLKPQLENDATGSSGPLKCCLVARRGDPLGLAYERVAELTNLKLAQARDAPSSGSPQVGLKKRTRDYEFYNVEVGKDSSVLSDLQVRTLPTFVVFKAGQMVYAGPFGGRKVKGTAPVARKTCLIIEPTFKYQIAMEKTLRKLGCDTFLTLNASEALARLSSYTLGGSTGGAAQAFDFVMISERINGHELDALGKKLGADVKTGRTVIAALVEMLGDRGKKNVKAVKWDKDFTTHDTGPLLQGSLAGLAKVAIQTPIKAASIGRLRQLQLNTGEGDAAFGLTPETMVAKLDQLDDAPISAGHPGLSSSSVGTRLQVDDIRMSGMDLTRKGGY